MKDRLTVAGVPIDPVTMTEALDRAAGFLSYGNAHLVVTPNPEMAVLAARDPGFRRLLEGADLALADGFGLQIAALIEGKAIPAIVTGTDFGLNLMDLAEQKSCSVYFLGAGEGTARAAADELVRTHPKLRVAGAESGGSIRWIAGAWQEEAALIERIAAAAPDILLVALGHGKQERWIRDHLGRLPSVKLAVGVGGAFDYYAGVVKRAPAAIRSLHLEWLWRLFSQPWRAWRIFEATFVFLGMVLKNRVKGVK